MRCLRHQSRNNALDQSQESGFASPGNHGTARLLTPRQVFVTMSGFPGERQNARYCMVEFTFGSANSHKN
jgi:hypothetical protein